MTPSPSLSSHSRDTLSDPSQESLAVFRTLLTRSHVERCLVSDDGEHNSVPQGLSTIVHLGGTPEQLESFYNSKRQAVPTWSLSPGRINDLEQRQRFLGDIRFQRAYMDYFSLQLIKNNHNIQTLMSSELFSGDRPLFFGLFGALGQPLVLLSDAVELQNPVLVVESLVLAAVDWSSPLHELLSDPQLASPGPDSLSPEAILGQIAYDGRFSGIMKSGPGFQHVNLILANNSARAAVVEYTRLLDLSDPALQIGHLAELAVRLLCCSHKKGQPAFDAHLGQLVTLIQSASILLTVLDGVSLVRGVWVLVVLSYVSQLRPVLDRSLVADVDLGDEEYTWGNMLSEFRGRRDSVRGKYLDAAFLRTIRSLFQLCEQQQGSIDQLCLAAAWKLRLQWKTWTGLGARGEDTLNIRL